MNMNNMIYSKEQALEAGIAALNKKISANLGQLVLIDRTWESIYHKMNGKRTVDFPIVNSQRMIQAGTLESAGIERYRGPSIFMTRTTYSLPANDLMKISPPDEVLSITRMKEHMLLFDIDFTRAPVVMRQYKTSRLVYRVTDFNIAIGNENVQKYVSMIYQGRSRKVMDRLNEL
jgi:hypothetical protein